MDSFVVKKPEKKVLHTVKKHAVSRKILSSG